MDNKVIEFIHCCKNFKKRFFHYGEVQDFIILTSKLVCNECLEKLNIANQLNVNKEFIKTNKAKFKFSMKCEECKKDFDLTLIPHVPIWMQFAQF